MKNKISVLLPLLVFASQALWHARTKSATYDEPAHLAVSWLIHATPHQDYDIGHPPFIRALFALPLRFMDPSLPSLPPPAVSESVPLNERPPGMLYVYSNLFLYQNRVPADALLFAARCVSVCLGLLLGLFVYLISSKLYGARSGVFSLWLFALCPNLIAHGSLVTTDMGGLAFALAFIYSLLLYLEKPSLYKTLACGISLGLALASKHTNIILPFIFMAAVLCRERNMTGIKKIFTVGALAWFTLCSVYGFDRVFMLHDFYKFLPLPDSFLRGLAFGQYHNSRGHASFFMGEHSAGGWMSYFPTAFLLKTPTMTLALALLALGLAIKNYKLLKFEEAVLAAPLVIVLAMSISAKLNIGLRHILLVYPVLFIFMGRILKEKFFETKKGVITAAGILLVIAAETFANAPDYLAFFNRPSGGASSGIKYLSDSNIDWGQDLKGLGEYLKQEGDAETLLSYFGTSVPMAHGIRAQGLPTVWEWPKSEHINSVNPKKELLAVSVTNLQGTYFRDPQLYAWLLNKTPVKKIGGSIYVYDVTNDTESQKKILEIYERTGEKEKILRQENRVKTLMAR